MSEPRHFGAHHGEILSVFETLRATWQRMDPKSGVALYPASYHETFLDMARAVVGDRYPGEVELPTRARDPLEREDSRWEYGVTAGPEFANVSAGTLDHAKELSARMQGTVSIIRRRPASEWEPVEISAGSGVE
jgi:hypothetical protein